MKFTRDWLFDHLDTDCRLDEILEILPMLGLEVESVTDRASALAPFTIAEVISAEQHPNADKLRVCMVNIGAGDPVQVVVGKRLHRIRRRCGSLVLSESPGSHCQAIHGPVGRLVERNRPKD